MHPRDIGKRYGKARDLRGLGDVLANAIQVATFGKVKPCAGCKDRIEKLNERFPIRQRKE